MPLFVYKILASIALAAGLFTFGLYEGYKYTKAAEAAKYEIARQAEVQHQNQVEAEFRVKEKDLLAQEQQLNKQIDEIKNATQSEPNSGNVCLTPDGVLRLNKIR